MSRNSKRRTPAHARAATRDDHPGLTPRNVVLAGLGAVAIGRRRASEVIDALAADVGDWPTRGRDAVADAGNQLMFLANQAGAQLAPLRRRAETKFAAVTRQAEALARDAEREFETVAAPVLVKLGLAPTPSVRPVSARKSAARKPAKRAAPVPAPKARKAPAKRTRAT